MTPRDPAPDIAAHRVLGDGTSIALIRPDAEVDWWCAPEVDSPPTFWSLLDPHGGAARWCDVAALAQTGPVAGPTARTLLHHGAARLDVWDALRCAGDRGPALIRMVRSLDGPLDVTHELSLGGFDAPWASWGGTAHAELAHADVVLVGGSSEPLPDGRTIRTRLIAPPAAWAALVVSFDPWRSADIEPLVQELEAAEREAGEIAARARLPGWHPHRARDALDVLMTCTQAQTGAVVAAPTTSLPEAPGHDRQFDYRFTWVRDASLAVAVAAQLGRRDIAEGYLGFLLHQTRDPEHPNGPMTDVRGDEVPREREVDGVAGWAGSQPVRVGNAASTQVQWDALGFLVEGVATYLRTGGHLDPRTWELVRTVAEHCAEDDDPLSGGIWEFREPRPLVSADIGRWLALDRAVRLAQAWRPWTRRKHWKLARDAARDRVLAALRPDGGLPQCYGDGESVADASALYAVLFGLIHRDDPRASRLVDATRAALGAGPFLHRYPPGGDDGFSGKEGAFVPMSWLVVSALANLGRRGEARQLAEELDARLPRLLSEEVDPATGAALGNVPLVWSHMEAARAMHMLDVADVLHRHGELGLRAWRGLRLVTRRRTG